MKNLKSTAPLFLSKIFELLLTLLIVSGFTFCAFSLIPGDCAAVMLGPNATQEQLESLRHELGIDRPLIKQYTSWLGGFFKGNLGKSYAYSKPVTELISQRLPVTIGLSIIALILILVISYITAVVSSSYPNGIIDHILSVLAHTTFAIPPFVLSLLTILFTSNVLGIFSVGNYVKPSEDFAGYLGCLFLPAFCIAVPKIAMTFKFLRSAIIEVKSTDYVRTAKSHGISDIRILFKHIIPNSSVSALTVISIVLSDVLGGSLIVEQVFNLPGLGRLLISGINHRDFPLLQGMVLYLAAITVILYFLTDLLNYLIDPRLRINNKGGNS